MVWLLDKVSYHWRWLGVTFTILLVLHSIVITFVAWRPTNITDLSPEFSGLEAIQRPASVVAYDGRLQVLFPLWNQDLSNTVIFLSAADVLYEKWRESLRAERADYIVTKKPSIELQFIQRHQDDFVLVQDNGEVKFWQIRR